MQRKNRFIDHFPGRRLHILVDIGLQVTAMKLGHTALEDADVLAFARVYQRLKPRPIPISTICRWLRMVVSSFVSVTTFCDGRPRNSSETEWLIGLYVITIQIEKSPQKSPAGIWLFDYLNIYTFIFHLTKQTPCRQTRNVSIHIVRSCMFLLPQSKRRFHHR